MQSTSSISSLIWSTADDDLRGLFKPSEYGRVILPFVVMRRLDCVLKSKKDEVYNLYQKFKDQFDDPSPVILRQIGLPFLTIKEVSELIGLSVSTINRLIKKGIFPNKIKLSTRRMVFVKKEIDEWIEEKNN